MQDSDDIACLEVSNGRHWKPRSLSVVSLERRPRFRDVLFVRIDSALCPASCRRSTGRDDATGDVCGIYFFENEEALAAFRETELAQTIPEAFEAVDVRREAYDVLYPLWPDRGPLSVDSWIDERKLESEPLT
jgi:hypothetical protein